MDCDNDPNPYFIHGSSIGLILLHGFTSTPQSVAYVGRQIHAATGATVSVPLLAGHGETPEALALTSYHDWLGSAKKELDRIRAECDLIVIAGLSLGGTIALNLSIRFPDLVDRVISINGSTGLYRPDQVVGLFNPGVDGFHRGIGSDIKHPTRRETCYDKIPLATMRERFVLTCATGIILPELKQPILVFQSREDHVVAPENGARIVRDVGSSDVRLQWLDQSYHVATLDNDRDQIVQQCSDFITELFSSPTG
ncbi:alpha/beta hydrolase [Peteryoungia algae]|uniref:Alpha/beta fold hydrolase n=1 Tax=Peteryoungia algae TaxID=2919917 RepID=A0ABT0D626_9HYPH|nr:alpha/beta fold hydrolase [Rhizobium sp. SSM4.3]MCJ8240749.1 alpha/beta fold hydrolase [Rhizobium sp. SSM4.3]